MQVAALARKIPHIHLRRCSHRMCDLPEASSQRLVSERENQDCETTRRTMTLRHNRVAQESAVLNIAPTYRPREQVSTSLCVTRNQIHDVNLNGFCRLKTFSLMGVKLPRHHRLRRHHLLLNHPLAHPCSPRHHRVRNLWCDLWNRCICRWSVGAFS